MDSAGKPVSKARVFNQGDAKRLIETTTSADGRFRLEELRDGPLWLFTEKSGYRFTAKRVQTGEDVTVKLHRPGERRPASDRSRPPVTFQDQKRIARQVLERLWRLPAEDPARNAGRIIKYMARIDPERAWAWSAELGGRFDDTIRIELAHRVAATSVEETPHA